MLCVRRVNAVCAPWARRVREHAAATACALYKRHRRSK